MRYFEDLAQSRISEKLSHGGNYIAVVRYLVGIYDDMEFMITTLRTMRDLDNATGYALNEIGKILGAYPRPIIPTISTLGVMQWDVTQWDRVPWASGRVFYGTAINDHYYRQYLKAIARMKNMRGTVEDWEDVFSLLGGVRAKIENKVDTPTVFLYGQHSHYDIIVFRELVKDLNNLTMRFRILN